MNLINLFGVPLYVDDINVLIPYSDDKRPFFIEDELALKSSNLHFSIKNDMLIKEEDYKRTLNAEKQQKTITASKGETKSRKDSPYLNRENFLAEKNPSQLSQESVLANKSIYVSSKNEFIPFSKKEQPKVIQSSPTMIQSKNVEDREIKRPEIKQNVIASLKRPEAGNSAKVDNQQFFTSFAQKYETEQKTAVEQFKEDGKMNLMFSGTARCAGGYSRMNRDFMFGLKNLGINVKWDALEGKNDMDKETEKKLAELTGIKIPQDAPKIYGMAAPSHYDWSRYKILLTMMETKTLHPKYIYNCNCADEIIVPSRWCKKVFEENGINKPISVVPLGVDVKNYNPEAKPYNLKGKVKDFVFLSIFGWSLRKGYDVLLKAYLEEFTSKDDVSLLISSRYFGSTDKYKKDVIKKDIQNIAKQIHNTDLPHLTFFGDSLSDAALPSLYTACDVGILMSRGEGHSYFPCEAAACGLPVISTNYSGQSDYLTHDNSYLIEVDSFAKAEKSLADVSLYYEEAEFPIFGKESIEQTRVLMRHVFEKRNEAQKKAKILREKIITEYSCEVAVQKMHDKLKDTYSKF